MRAFVILSSCALFLLIALGVTKWLSPKKQNAEIIKDFQQGTCTEGKSKKIDCIEGFIEKKGKKSEIFLRRLKRKMPRAYA